MNSAVPAATNDSNDMHSKKAHRFTVPNLRHLSQPNLTATTTAAPAAPPPDDEPKMLPQTKVLRATYKVGQFKAKLPLQYLVVQSFMAGLYKSVGCLVFVVVGGGVLGAALFPVGLIAISLTGAELFTGDLLVITVCLLANKVSWSSLLRNLVVSWFGNFAGTLVWASVVGYVGGAVEDNGRVDFVVDLAETKSYMTWGEVVCKGIGANFLVCLAVWQAMTAQDVASKILAIWFPIVAFVTVGLEHVVANMFFIPLGMMFGADVTVGRMLWYNLIPSTIGNVIGGAFGVALPFWFLFDNTAKELELMSNVSDVLSNGVKRMKRTRIAHSSTHDSHDGSDHSDEDHDEKEDENQDENSQD